MALPVREQCGPAPYCRGVGSIPRASTCAEVPLIEIVKIGDADPIPYKPNPTQPLSGIRALSLTHVIAGHVRRALLRSQGGSPAYRARQAFEHEGLRHRRQCRHAFHFDEFATRNPDARHFSDATRRPTCSSRDSSGRAMESLGFGVEEVAKRSPGIVYVLFTLLWMGRSVADRSGFDMEASYGVGLYVCRGRRSPSYGPEYGTTELTARPPAFPPTLGAQRLHPGLHWAAGVSPR